MNFQIIQGDALTVLRTLPAASVNCCITSPPYWALRDYGTASWDGGDPKCSHQVRNNPDPKNPDAPANNGRGPASEKLTRDRCRCGAQRVDQQMGLETVPDCLGWATGERCGACYICRMVTVFAEVKRVLRDDGTLWLNMGDSYQGGGRHHGEKNPGKSATNRGSRSAQDRNPSSYRRDKADVGGFRHKDANLKPKDLCGMPWRLALALQADGWWLRSDIIWHKNNPMPESVTDRPTKAHEYLFLLAKSERYHFDAAAIAEKASPESHARYARGRSDDHKWADGGPGDQSIAKSFEGMRDRTPAGWHQGTRPATPSGIRDKSKKVVPGKPAQVPIPGVHPKSAAPGSGIKANSSFSAAVKDLVETRNKRSVWTISTMATPDAHFATFPIEIPEICLLAGCPEGGTVLDVFAGAGTSGLACLKNNRNFLGIELKAEYMEIAHKRARERYSLLVESAV